MSFALPLAATYLKNSGTAHAYRPYHRELAGPETDRLRAGQSVTASANPEIN